MFSACSSGTPTTVAPGASGAPATSSTATATNSGSTAQFQDFVGAFNNIANNLDPAQASGQPELEFARAAYETLVNYDPVQAKLIGALADSWQSSPDVTSFTLHLRANVSFHDGSQLTADSVKASLDRTNAIGKGESYLISGIQSVNVVDPSSIEIKLKNPDAGFLFNLTRMFIVSGQAIKDNTSSADPNAVQWFSQHEAGSGPYGLTQWTSGQVMILSHFPDYWQGWDGPHIGQYTLKVVPQAATQQLMLQRGEVDSADSILPEDAATLQSDANLKVAADPGSPMYITFNPANPALKDVRVRRAITEAVDYRAVIDGVMKGFAKPLAGPTPAELWAYDTSLQPAAYNLDNARQLLEQAGYGPSNPITLNLVYFSGWAFESNIAALLQNALAKIGVTLKVQGMPWATFSAQAGDPKARADMGIVAVWVPTPAPGPVITASFDPASEGGWAYWGYNNPEVTDLLHKAEANPNDNSRMTDYQQLQQMLVQDYAAIWLMQMDDIFVFRNNVKGYVHDPAVGLILNWHGVYKD